MIGEAGGALAVAFRLVVLAATTGALGAWIFARLVVPAAAGETAVRHRAALIVASVRVAMTCTALIAMAFVPRLIARARALNDPGDPVWPTMLSVLETRWGWVLVVQAIAAVAAFVGLLAARPESRSRVAGAAVAVLAVAPAFLGHAGADPDHRTVSVLVDVVHVAAAGGWVGVLWMLTLVAWRCRHEDDVGVLVASLILAFHPIAMLTAGAVFATGLATAWLRMGAPVGIANPTYSGLFVAKVLLVGVMAALGAGHAKHAKKRVQRVDAVAVGRSLLGETLLAVLVLVVTAVLTGTAPIG